MGIRSERVPSELTGAIQCRMESLYLLASCISSLRRSGVRSPYGTNAPCASRAWKRQLFSSSRVGDRGAFERRHGSRELNLLVLLLVLS